MPATAAAVRPEHRRLRVMHVLQSLQVGGLEKVVHNLVRATADDTDSLVFATHEEGPLRGALEAAGAVVRCANAGAGLQPRLPWALATAARAFGADVVHSHHLGPFLYSAPAAALLRLPHIHTEHSHEFYDTPRRRLLGRSLGRSAQVVACSAAVARFHQETFGTTVQVIDNGVDVDADAVADVWPGDGDAARREARCRLGVHDDNAVVLGCVARLAPEKDHAILLTAFAALLAGRNSDSRPVYLVLVGDGPERAALEQQAREERLTPWVRFLGTRSDVSALWPGIDLAVLASRREGLPLSLLEGLAAGVPFVATAVGAVPSLAAFGAVVRPQDTGALAQGLAFLVDDDVRRHALGEAGRREVIDRYSTTAMAAGYRQLWRQAVGA
jgi:glycosyltransferase involved in cell wall biosynthesis